MPIPVTIRDHVDRLSCFSRIPFFAGFYSKDMILEAAYGAHTSVGMLAFLLGRAAALPPHFREAGVY